MTKFLPGRGSGGHSLVITTLVDTDGGGGSYLGGHLLDLLLDGFPKATEPRSGKWHFLGEVNVIVSNGSTGGEDQRIETATLGTDGLGTDGVIGGIAAGSKGIFDGGKDGLHGGCF